MTRSGIVNVAIVGFMMGGCVSVEASAQADDSVRSWPPDLTNYVRPALLQDFVPRGRAAVRAAAFPATFPDVMVVDTVVSNTNPNLTNTDTFGDSEPSIAVNTKNPDEIVITAFSGAWSSSSGFAPLWHSTDGGNTWTKEFTIPAPPGISGAVGCPCDQEVDYGRGGGLSATFLTSPSILSQ